MIQRTPLDRLADFVPEEWRAFEDPQRALPRLARSSSATRTLEKLVSKVPSRHRLIRGDARATPRLPPESVHLVLTSPPYWTLKEYPEAAGQMGHIGDYGAFVEQLDKVWKRCLEVLVPGGRMVCVVGDVCLARRKYGRHSVVPLHSSIQEHCREMGYDNLAPIVWHKITNAACEARRPGTFLGKPYEPNGIIKNDIEFILMLRKPGAYRSPSLATKLLSLIPAELHREWFRQVWNGPGGASTRDHPAPFPLEIAERLVRMFSFVGDRVYDPFMGTGTTQVAAAMWGRDSIGVEIDPDYFDLSVCRLRQRTKDAAAIEIEVCKGQDSGAQASAD